MHIMKQHTVVGMVLVLSLLHLSMADHVTDYYPAGRQGDSLLHELVQTYQQGLDQNQGGRDQHQGATLSDLISRYLLDRMLVAKQGGHRAAGASDTAQISPLGKSLLFWSCITSYLSLWVWAISD